MSSIEIMIVDDQTLFVHSLKTLLELDSNDIKVIKTVFSGEEAIKSLQTITPDVILMDIRMKDMDGVETTRRILERFPNQKILILTMFEEDGYVNEALRIGARGFLLKDIPPEELIAGIKAVATGGIMISPQVVSKLVSHQSVFTGRIDFDMFSRREIEVLQSIGEGLDNQEIADELNLSEQTVRNYVSVIYTKSGIRVRNQLIKAINRTQSSEE